MTDTSIADWLQTHVDEAMRLAPAHKNELTVTVTNERGVYALLGQRHGEEWRFSLGETTLHEEPWPWGVQIDYRW